MTKRLKRIAPVQFGLVLGIIYGLLALVFVPFILLGSLVSLLTASSQNGAAQGFSFVFALLIAVLAPIFYAVFGGLFGMLAAWVYNVVASWVGGVEIVVE